MPVKSPVSLTVTPAKVIVAPGHQPLPVTLSNTGTVPITVHAWPSLVEANCVPGGQPVAWARLTRAQATLAPGQHVTEHVRVTMATAPHGQFGLAVVFATSPGRGAVGISQAVASQEVMTNSHGHGTVSLCKPNLVKQEMQAHASVSPGTGFKVLGHNGSSGIGSVGIVLAIVAVALVAAVTIYVRLFGRKSRGQHR